MAEPQWSAGRAARVIFARDVKVYFRSRSAWLNPLLFVFLAITLFALGIGPNANELAAVAPGIVWVIALLGILMSMEMLFKSDFDDGSLEQLLISPSSLYFALVAKVCAMWLVSGLPMVVLSPLFALMLDLPVTAIPVLAMGLMLGTGILNFVGGIGAAITVSLRSGGLLLALLVLPLYVPVIIFGSRMIQHAIDGWTIVPSLLMLSGLLIAAVTLAPLAMIGGLKLSVDA